MKLAKILKFAYYKEKKMANKRNWLGVLVIVLVFGIYVVGCVSTDATIHDFGDVSGENYALIQVSPVYNGGNGNVWQFYDFVKINGQGDRNMWKAYTFTPIRGSQSIVRVSPGEYTFTITFVRSIQNALSGHITSREIPVDITFTVKAGKGYKFEFSTTRESPPVPTAPTFAEITILEGDINEISSIFYTSDTAYIEVAKRTERFYMPTDDLGF
jgi:hypothetical protein